MSHIRLPLSHSTLRYLLVGSSLFLIDLSIVYALVRAGMHAGWAQLIGRATGAGLGFAGHRLFTFREKGMSWKLSLRTQSVGYLVVTIAMLLLSPAVLLACLKLTDGHLVWAKGLAEVVLVSVTYVALRVVFLTQRNC